ncbi:uncharacterized protein LOC132272386 [Cornus florida]|uniref:uncharacterized protein LOC132272386 n=1 Tax=Cornus florida TaxID=4283 RepID=UPI002898A5F0|nr:uncharacterized protein LOC132272386 [Cornus florida]
MDDGQVINKSPGFEGSNYDSWKTRMEDFFMYESYDVWHATVYGVVILNLDNPSTEAKLAEANDGKAKHVMFCALKQQKFTRVKNCKTAKEMWDSFQVAHEGNKVINENKIQLFKVQYEVCKMEEKETFAEYMCRINDLVNNMRALGEDIKDVDINELQAFLTAYEMRISVLAIYRREATLKAKEVVEETKTKSEDDLKEDEVAYLAKKFRKFRFKKKNQLKNLTCYGCGKLGHVVSNCSNLKGQNQKKNEGAPEEDKSEETQEDEGLFMSILEAPQTPVQVKEDSDTKIEKILEEYERLIVKSTKVNQTHSVFVKATTGEVYARCPIIKRLSFKGELLNNTCSALSFNKRDFVTTAIRNFKITRMYVKDKGSLVKTKMMWIPKKLNFVSLFVYTTFKACNTQDKWYVDSGYSRHMTGDGSKFNSLKQFDGGNVIFGDNQRAKIVGIDTVSKSEELLEIQEILLVEGLRYNLLSVSYLCDSGKEVCFNKERCNVIDLESK